MDKFKLALLATIEHTYSRVETWAEIIPQSTIGRRLSDDDWKEIIAELAALESQLGV